LSRHRIRFRIPLRLATIGRLVSNQRRVLFRRPSAVTGLAVGTAVVAAISLGTAMLWPADAASNGPATATHSHTITQGAGAFTAIDTGLDARQVRSAELVAQDHAARLMFIRAEKARKAAERRALAAAAAAAHAARQRAQQQRQQQAAASAPASSGSSGSSGTTTQPSGSPQEIASGMLGSFGWGQNQFGCLVSLWNAESGWNPSASNPSSGAYGIPQALPGSKMASAGADWQTNPATQIRWGLGYIHGLYGTPCGAWGHEQSTGWY
jgi:hypothetical protein